MQSAPAWRGMAARHQTAGNRRKRRTAIAAGAATLAAAGLAGAFAGQPAHAATTRTAAPAASASSASASHATQAQAKSTVAMTVYFTANGVNIHKSHSTSSGVRGLGYKGQSFDVTSFYDNSTWLYGRDNNTGVWGWVLARYTI